MWGRGRALTITIARERRCRAPPRIGGGLNKEKPCPDRYGFISGAGKLLLLGYGGFALTQG